MTLRNDKLAERFVRGADTGQASRMRIETINDVRYVEGYGWALYAAASPGGYYLFGDGHKTDNTNVGWAGYSSTTTNHIQILKRALVNKGVNFAVVDKRVESDELLSTAPEAVAGLLNELKQEHEVEPNDYTGYHYKKTG